MNADDYRTEPGKRFTAVPAAAPNKGFWLILLLLALLGAIGLFLWMLLPRALYRVHAVSLVISNYNDAAGLPDPAWAEWPVVERDQRFVDQGIAPWRGLASGGSVVETADQLRAAPKNWQAEARQQGLGRRDTLVVYLRCHSLVNPSENRVWLLGGNFRGGKLGQPGAELEEAILWHEFLTSLSQIPVGNVVVLADCMDLRSVPRLGLLLNPVTRRMQEECHAFSSSNRGPRIWVIAAAGNLQTAHVSDLRRRTLLQSAAEYACQPGLHETQQSDGMISLTEFYEGVLRYACKVTEGGQTPLLFQVGSRTKESSGRGLTPGQAGWRQASQVAVAMIPRQKKAAKEQPPENGTAATGTAPPATAAPVAADGTGPEQLPPTEWERAWLPIWTALDECEARGLGGPAGEGAAASGGVAAPGGAAAGDGFSPADFAPGLWQEIRASAVREDRLDRIGRQPDVVAADGRSADIRELAAVLVRLKQDMQAGRRTGEDAPSAFGKGLQAGWNELLAAMSPPDSPLGPWKEPERLPRIRRKEWEVQRKGQREAADFAVRIPRWFEWAIADPESASLARDLVRHYPPLLERLQQQPLTAGLVSNTSLVALQSAESALIQRIEDAIRRLQEKRNRKQQLTWADEQVIQRLLDAAPLRAEQRRRLRRLRDSLDVRALEEPEQGDIHVAGSEKTVEDLLGAAARLNPPNAMADAVSGWCTALGAWARACGLEPGEPSSAIDDGAVVKWARELRQMLGDGPGQTGAAEDAAVGGSPLQRWHLAAGSGVLGQTRLAAIIPGMHGEFAENRVLYVDGPLEPVQLDRYPEPGRILVGVRRADGRLCARAAIRWDLPDPVAGGEDMVQLLVDGRPVPRGDFHPDVVLSQGNFQAQLRVHPDAVPGGTLALNLWAAVPDPSGERTAMPAELVVVPPRPDRIELIVRHLNPGPDGPVDSAPVPPDGRLPDRDRIRVPAVGNGVAASFDLLLANQSARDKQVRVRLHAAEPPDGIGRFGSGDDQNLDYRPDPQDELFQSGPVKLPGSGAGQTGQPVRVAMEWSSGTGSKPPDRFHGLLCVVQELEQAGESLQETGRQYRYWIGCQPLNPYDGRLVEIRPERADELLRLELVVPEPQRRQFAGLKKLPVSLELRDARGTNLLGRTIDRTLDGAGGWRTVIEIRKSELVPEKWDPPAFVEVSIGEYRRAVVFFTRFGMDDLADVWPNPSARIDLRNAVLLSTDLNEPLEGLEIPTAGALAGALILPNHSGANDRDPGQDVRAGALSLPVQFGIPATMRRSGCRLRMTLTQEGGFRSRVAEQAFLTDRHFRPAWSADEGSMSLAVTAGDLPFEIGRTAGLRGPHRLDVAVEGASEPLASARLVFDREPPEQPEIVPTTSLAVLYSDSELAFAVKPRDELTEVRSVYFGLGSGEQRNYRAAKPFPPDAARQDDGRWVLSLKGDDPMIKNQPAGEFLILVRCVDAAGNVQDLCKPADFLWKPEPRPARAPGGQ